MPIIEISSLTDSGVEIFSTLTEAQLRNRIEPDKGLLIAESPKVIHVALNAGYEPLALWCEQKHITCLLYTSTMDILIIAVLIIAAVILFLVELFVIPGISLAGISALVCILYANYYAFTNLGMAGGFVTLGISAVACIGSLIWFMRSQMLDKLALKKDID